MPTIKQRLRHKQTISRDARHRKHGDAFLERASTNFNLDIDLPVGGADPDMAGVNMTATGPISVNTGVTFHVWYTDSNGNNTPLGTPTIAGASSPYHWSLTFLAPGAVGTNDFTFSIQATYTPLNQVGSTTILITAPFTTVGLPPGGLPTAERPQPS